MKDALDAFLDAWIDDQEDKRKMALRRPRGLHPDWLPKPPTTVVKPRRKGKR